MSLARSNLTADAILYTLVYQVKEARQPSNVLPGVISQTLSWAPAGLTEGEVIEGLQYLCVKGYTTVDLGEVDWDSQLDEITSLRDGEGCLPTAAGLDVVSNHWSVWRPNGPASFTIVGSSIINSNIAAGSGVYQNRA